MYLPAVSFRCQSAEELRLRFPESHQQQHLHLPQVGASPYKPVYPHRCVMPLFIFLTFVSLSSPFRNNGQKNQKKQEEKKADTGTTSEANSSSSPKHKGECLRKSSIVDTRNKSVVHQSALTQMFLQPSSSPSWLLFLPLFLFLCLCYFFNPHVAFFFF